MFRVWVLPLVALACAGPWAITRLLMHAPPRRAVLEAAFVGYLGVLCYVVFCLPNRVGPGDVDSIWTSVNVVPTRTILEIIRDAPRLVTMQLLDNVGMFVPLGAFLPLLSARCRRFVTTATVGFAVSVGIELVQLAMLLTGVSRRAFDVDDVVLNVTGACLGYVMWRGAHALARPVRRGPHHVA